MKLRRVTVISLEVRNKVQFFYDWFCINYSNIFCESVIQCVRVSAGLGKPPSPFYNNCSKSVNKLIKQHVYNQKSLLPGFLKHLHTLFEEQSNSMKKATKQTGDWCLRVQWGTEVCHLSYPSDPLLQFCTLDKGILDSIWKKVAQLVHSKGFIMPIPGDFVGSKGRMVASSSSMSPHMVTVGQKNDCLFICDRHCPRYTAYKFCANTITVAEASGCLNDYQGNQEGQGNSKHVKVHLPWITKRCGRERRQTKAQKAALLFFHE